MISNAIMFDVSVESGNHCLRDLRSPAALKLRRKFEIGRGQANPLLERRPARIGQPVLIASGFDRIGFEAHFLPSMAVEPAPVVARFVHRDTVDPRLERTVSAE